MCTGAVIGRAVAPDALLVRLEHLQQLEADAHPLARGHELGAAVGDAANEVNAVLLHLFVPVLQNGCQPRQQILDRRRHFGHADHVYYRLRQHAIYCGQQKAKMQIG